ncbi:MAG: hypothetical protein LIV22_05920 [Olegusella sp.]|nr:hypothetical protein [Olegusella sp.]
MSQESAPQPVCSFGRSVAETSLPITIADDSGLCVDTLDVAPGGRRLRRHHWP